MARQNHIPFEKACTVRCLVLFFLLPWVGVPSAWADALQVLTTGAFKQVVQGVVSDFEARTGHQVRVVNDTAGALTRRIEQGEPFDVLILTPSALQMLQGKGMLLPGTLVDLARGGGGVAVRQGQPRPPLKNQEDFVQLLKSARKVAYIDPASGGSSGIYLQGLFRQLNLESMLSDKSVLVQGGLVAEKLVTAEADVAIHQISEILAVTGVDLVGPLPPAIQNYTRYAGALGRHSDKTEIGQSFLQALTSPLAVRIMVSKGLER